MNTVINTSNYEAFAIDYLEGNLEGEALVAFEQFLLAHPEIAESLGGMDECVLAPMDVPRNIAIDDLKVEMKPVGPINEDNYESYMAMAVDADLNAEAAQQTEAFVDENPALAKTFRQYQHTRLAAEQSIVFPATTTLKVAIPLWQQPATYWRAAASIAAMIGLFWLADMGQDQQYIPRIGVDNWAALPALQFKTQGEATDRHSSSSDMQSVAAASSITRAAPIQPLAIASLDPIERGIPALNSVEESPAMAIVDLPAVNSTNATETLNMAQFIGKTVLNVPASESENAKELLTAGVQKVISERPGLEYESGSEENDKKVFRLLAGAIEFKRVTYASN